MHEVEILIENEGVIYKPLVLEDVTWETERVGVPGKLTFSILNNNTPTEMHLNIQEGNRVTFRYDNQPVFSGFLFTKKRSKDQIISVTAYDQLRYLKNKFTYQYQNWTAAQLLRQVAADFQLRCGDVEETAALLSRTEDAQTLFDIILNALDENARLTGDVYVMYDDFGAIALKNISHLLLDCLICDRTAEDFSYESTIDKETYNSVKLYYDDETQGKRRTIHVYDSGNMARWGTLELYQKIDDPQQGELMGSNYLKLFNSKRRNLSVSGAFGDIRARAGASVPVSLVLGDVNANSYLLIEKATHRFSQKEHRMDLTLRGDVFV